MAKKDSTIEVEGKSYDSLMEAIDAVRETWSKIKEPAVAEQIAKANQKGAPIATLPKLDKES